MQEFEPSSKYNCIVLRYCIGYLDDREASQFLGKLAHSMVPTAIDPNDTGSDAERQASYILVQDQTVQESEDEVPEYGQTVRKESSLHDIFEQSGLSLVSLFGPVEVHEDMLPVKVWVLAQLASISR